jgi:hypothetical protein
MRPFLIALMLLPLAVCFSDHRNEQKIAATARCVTKAKADGPRAPDQSLEEYIDSLGPAITECMRMAGYVF